MRKYDGSVQINYNLNWPYIFHHPYRVLIIGELGSGKTNLIELKNPSATRHW